jgi:hypothetical protein
MDTGNGLGRLTTTMDTGNGLCHLTTTMDTGNGLSHLTTTMDTSHLYPCCTDLITHRLGKILSCYRSFGTVIYLYCAASARIFIARARMWQVNRVPGGTQGHTSKSKFVKRTPLFPESRVLRHIKGNVLREGEVSSRRLFKVNRLALC